ncbi:MAG: benD [Caulobacteraceae bacterium]|nr:benD [Caulobacteraceae bacterium]
MDRLKDKVALITGGASGIGAAAARLFAAEGARVIVADVQADLGREVAADVDGLFVQLDVAHEPDWTRAAGVVEERHGRLDVVFNNAGVVCGRSIEDMDLATWDRVIGINLTGVMLGCRTGIRLMKANPGGPGGSLINTASTAAYAAIPGDPAYSATKSAVRLLTKAVAVHCARSGYAIRCNSLHPGATDTPILSPALQAAPQLIGAFNAMSPMGRMGRPEEIAAVALFLASDEASYVTGAEYLADGGMLAGHPGI